MPGFARNFPLGAMPHVLSPEELRAPALLNAQNADRYQYLNPKDFVVWGAGQYATALAQVICTNLERFHRETLGQALNPESNQLRLYLNPHRDASTGDPSEKAIAELARLNTDRMSKHFSEQVHPCVIGTHDPKEALRGCKHVIIGVDGSRFDEATDDLVKAVTELRQSGDIGDSIQFVFVTKGLPTEEQTNLSLICPSDHFVEKLRDAGGWRPGDEFTVQHGAAFARTLYKGGHFELVQASRNQGNGVLAQDLTAAIARVNGVVESAAHPHSIELSAILKNVAACFCQYVNGLCLKYQNSEVFTQEDLVLVPYKARMLIAEELNAVHRASMSNHKDPNGDIFRHWAPLNLDFLMTIDNPQSRNGELGLLLAKHETLGAAVAEIEANRGGKVTFESLQTLGALVPWLQAIEQKIPDLHVSFFDILTQLNRLIALRGNGEPVTMTVDPVAFGPEVRMAMIRDYELQLLQHIITSK